jgi:hypothetical protein
MYEMSCPLSAVLFAQSASVSKRMKLMSTDSGTSVKSDDSEMTVKSADTGTTVESADAEMTVQEREEWKSLSPAEINLEYFKQVRQIGGEESLKLLEGGGGVIQQCVLLER